MTATQEDGGPTVHVLFRKEELDPGRAQGKVVIVVDVLFATTSIIAALEAGAAAVYPARNPDEALALSERPALRKALLAGEADFRFIDGFLQPTPLALSRHIDSGDDLIYATTNGTVALRACAGARRVLVGSLRNAGATVAALDPAPGDTVIILCAGTSGTFNLEDFYGAGCLVQRIAAAHPGCRLTDAAQAAGDCFAAYEPGALLRRSLVGRLMLEWGLDAEVAYAARTDASTLAAEMRNGHVEAL